MQHMPLSIPPSLSHTYTSSRGLNRSEGGKSKIQRETGRRKETDTVSEERKEKERRKWNRNDERRRGERKEGKRTT